MVLTREELRYWNAQNLSTQEWHNLRMSTGPIKDEAVFGESTKREIEKAKKEFNY